MFTRVFKFFGFVYISLNLFIVYLYFDEIKLSDEISFLNLNKCPYCYGMDICDELLAANHFKKYQITFNEAKNCFFFNSYFFQKIFNVKNFWFGTEMFSGTELVFKKLAHDSELDSFDRTENFCLNEPNNNEFCMSSIVKLNRSIVNKKLNEKSLASISKRLGVQCTECFPQRLIDQLYSDTSRRSSYLTQNLMFLTTLKINPEPVVLQVKKSII